MTTSTWPARMRHLLALTGFCLLTACGGGDGSSTPSGTAAPTTNTPATPSNPSASSPSTPPTTGTGTQGIGATVSGLSGQGLLLQLNGEETLAVASNGSFNFSTTLAAGAAFAVTIASEPRAPAQTCTVTHGSGRVSSAGTAQVEVTCDTQVVNGKEPQLNLNLPPNISTGVLLPLLATEVNGMTLTRLSWTFDGAPGGYSITGYPELAGLLQSGSSIDIIRLAQWRTPGKHTVQVSATTQDGRQAMLSAEVQVVGPPVAAGTADTCMLGHSTGKVLCWGWGNTGILGSHLQNSPRPLEVDGLTGAVSVTLGEDFGCALLPNGQANCWGNNDVGQLGNLASLHAVSGPVQVDALENLVAVSAGRYHACALKSDGTVHCWGSNQQKQLGSAVTASSTVTPTRIEGVSDAVAIGAGGDGGDYACALKADGTVVCWGDNAVGQLGMGSESPVKSAQPLTVRMADGSPLTKAISLVTGPTHACAVVNDGHFSLYCWGDLYTTRTPSAIPIPGVHAPVLVTLGTFNTCTWDMDTDAGSYRYRCWGNNEYGQATGAGSGTSSVGMSTPAPLIGWQENHIPLYIALGRTHQCGIFNNGTAACLGSNSYGQLGNASFDTSFEVTPVDAPESTFWNWYGG